MIKLTAILLLIATLSYGQECLRLLPDPGLTPGDTVAGASDKVCLSNYAKSIRDVSASKAKKVFKRYGIEDPQPGDWEVDHLIPCCLGGSSELSNLWPQAYNVPGWSAHKKDRLEVRLRRMVCVGKISLQQAQTEIARDWIAAYKKYVPDSTKVGVMP